MALASLQSTLRYLFNRVRKKTSLRWNYVECMALQVKDIKDGTDLIWQTHWATVFEESMLGLQAGRRHVTLGNKRTRQEEDRERQEVERAEKRTRPSGADTFSPKRPPGAETSFSPKRPPRAEASFSPIRPPGADASFSPLRPLGEVPPATPFRVHVGLPNMNATPQPLVSVDSDPEIENETETAVQKAHMDLVREAVSKLRKRSKKEDLILGEGKINMHEILLKLQQQMLRTKTTIQKTNAFMYLWVMKYQVTAHLGTINDLLDPIRATRSCILLEKTFPPELQGILQPSEYAAVRNFAVERFGCKPAAPEYVQTHNLPALAKVSP
ncbi:hypothetical protein HDU86_001760 [Geranomyces michiganensis]|nr:hypothetical protein HDU86_001760 [Geranomyces michiganensis]